MTTKTHTTHTPGPWKAHKPAQSEGVPSDGWTIRFDGPSHHWHVATVYGQEKPTGIKYDQGENAANARLIAAAPDLLDACKNIVAACELTEDAYYDAIDTAMNIARAAIAKAEGTA